MASTYSADISYDGFCHPLRYVEAWWYNICDTETLRQWPNMFNMGTM